VELEASVSKQGATVKQAKSLAKETGSEADAAAARDAVAELLRLKDALAASNTANPPSALPTMSSGEVDYAQDFFGRRAYLTVSGQLNGVFKLDALCIPSNKCHPQLDCKWCLLRGEMLSAWHCLLLRASQLLMLAQHHAQTPSVFEQQVMA
jgi:hypothetical protein